MAGFDFNLQQQLSGNKPVTADEEAKEVFDVMTQGADKAIDTIGKAFFFGLLPSGLLKVGIFAHFNIEQAAPLKVDGMINKAAEGYSAKGGMLASTIIKGLQVASLKDFSKVSAPEIASLPTGDSKFDYSDASFASLGSITPSATPNMGSSNLGADMGGIA